MSGETVTTRVPRPERRHTQVAEFGRQLELRSPRFAQGRGCAAAFLGLWLIGWTAGCSMLLAQVRADPSLLNIAIEPSRWRELNWKNARHRQVVGPVGLI